MAIREAMHVQQGDDQPVHVTVRDHRTRDPKDLTGWSAYLTVVEDSEGAVIFDYNTNDDPSQISIDDQSDAPGGISIVFKGTDIPLPVEKWHRLRITHPSEAPSGRTVRFGPFIVDDT